LPGQLSGQKTRSRYKSWPDEETTDGATLSVYEGQLGTKYADITPLHSTKDREALHAAFRQHGRVTSPITVDRKTDEIIDGKIRHAFDPNCPRVYVDLDTDAQRFAMAIVLNDGRRNMTPEQRTELLLKKREIAAQLFAEKNDDGTPRFTQTQIGAQLGVSQDTVSLWLSTDNVSLTKARSAYIEEARKHRTKVDKEDRKAMWKASRSGATHEQIAADFGVSRPRVTQIVGGYQMIVDAEAQAEKDARAAARGARGGHILVGDFRDKGAAIKDESVDLIFTDPPYDRPSLPLYRDLGKFASRVLIRGGSLICYCGHYSLLEVGAMLQESLTYHWIIAVTHTGGNRTFPGKFVHVGWKPLLWFIKGKARATRNVVRDCIAMEGGHRHRAMTKDVYHEWAQSEAEASYYISQLARRKGLVVDPFSGGGTTGAAARKLGRRFVGFEIEPEHARKAAGRIAATRMVERASPVSNGTAPPTSEAAE
jgi:hypothetical protein